MMFFSVCPSMNIAVGGPQKLGHELGVIRMQIRNDSGFSECLYIATAFCLWLVVPSSVWADNRLPPRYLPISLVWTFAINLIFTVQYRIEP
jgi:hypothetical protein